MLETSNTPPPLYGKVAVVVGASRGIGAAVARAYAEAGAAVALAARDAAALEALASELAAAGAQAIAVPTDVTDPATVASLVEQVVATFGRLDLACNNAAGGGHPPTPLAEVPVEAFDSAFAVNLRGVFVAMRHEIPAMIAGGGGAIVNMSSTAGVEAVRGLAAYVSTKHGLEGLTKVAALDHAGDGVRVNAIAPGPILTDNLRRAGPDAQQRAASALPLAPGRTARGGRRRCRVAVLRRSRLHHRHDPGDRWRPGRRRPALHHRKEGQLMHEITTFLDEWTDAERAGDTAVLGRVLTDDFVGVGPLGFMLPKPAWLARHEGGDLRYEAFGLDELDTRVHGHAALVTARHTAKGTYQGHRS